ncbi:MAG TPA: phosphotransferase family protein [Acidimicrobiia bacterium]|nr:phosphotransferase family protein [Acidimicrobiia bacterium]
MATQQSTPVDLGEAVPAERLGPWLAEHVPGAAAGVSVEQLAGGSSNLTFRVRDGAHDWVLRRPPLRGGLATAHDMTREFRVQAALAGTGVPVAPMVVHCSDDTVIGAPFYVMEYLDGVVYDDADAVAGLSEEQSRAASFELVDVLARLHAVEPEAVGLGDFGRPAGYLARQVARWQTQWAASKTVDMPAVEEVARRLERSLPAEGRHGIVHGDYSFNNTMFRADDGTRMQAVLDWEMSTLGDPLTDVGTLAVYWAEAGEIMWRDRTPQAHRANPGFPDADTLLDRYATTSGTDLASIDFYRAFATWKLAVIAQGALLRLRDADPERVARTTETVATLAELALGFTDTR